MPWISLHMQVTTPLFNDGARGDAGVRPPSLRGGMRFWFRTLAGIGVGPDLDTLAALEARVFGDTQASSPFRLRIPAQPAVNEPGAPDWCNRGYDGRGLMYLLGQGLAKPVRDEHPPPGRWRYLCRVERHYVPAGAEFDLQINHRDEDAAALALASLWLLCTYGGLGARTRRGWGGLRILGCTGPLPDPWNVETLRSPNLSYYEPLQRLWPGNDPIGAAMRTLTRLAAGRFQLGAWPKETRPTYPVFSRWYTRAATTGRQPGWSEMLAYAGEQLRWFRADTDHPAAGYTPPVKTHEWLETVWGDDTRFPVGALGLPVNFKDGYVARAASRETGDELRRASPLWLRPVGEGRSWRLLSFAFLNDFLPDTAQVELHKDRQYRKTLTVTDNDIDDTVHRWINVLNSDGTFVRTKPGAASRIHK